MSATGHASYSEGTSPSSSHFGRPAMNTPRVTDVRLEDAGARSRAEQHNAKPAVGGRCVWATKTSALVQLARSSDSNTTRTPLFLQPRTQTRKTLTSTTQRLPPPLLLWRLSIFSSAFDAKLVVFVLVVIVFRFFELVMLRRCRWGMLVVLVLICVRVTRSLSKKSLARCWLKDRNADIGVPELVHEGWHRNENRTRRPIAPRQMAQKKGRTKGMTKGTDIGRTGPCSRN